MNMPYTVDELSNIKKIPLLELLTRLPECAPDPADKHNWRTPQGRISTMPNDLNVFYNHDLQKGGKGIIDFVQIQYNLEFVESIKFIEKTITLPKLHNINQENLDKKKPEFAQPVQPEKTTWGRALSYLTNVRHLPLDLVENLHSQGLVFSDRFGNCVFRLINLKKETIGSEIRGTGDKTFHGVRGEKGLFVIPSTNSKKEIAFVESAIDAMSLRSLGFSGSIISFTGNMSDKWLKAYGTFAQKNGYTLFAAFDNDKAGEQMTNQLLRFSPDLYRLKPQNKDWNDDLKNKLELSLPFKINRTKDLER